MFGVADHVGTRTMMCQWYTKVLSWLCIRVARTFSHDYVPVQYDDTRTCMHPKHATVLARKYPCSTKVLVWLRTWHTKYLHECTRATRRYSHDYICATRRYLHDYIPVQHGGTRTIIYPTHEVLARIYPCNTKKILARLYMYNTKVLTRLYTRATQMYLQSCTLIPVQHIHTCTITCPGYVIVLTR